MFEMTIGNLEVRISAAMIRFKRSSPGQRATQVRWTIIDDIVVVHFEAVCALCPSSSAMRPGASLLLGMLP